MYPICKVHQYVVEQVKKEDITEVNREPKWLQRGPAGTSYSSTKIGPFQRVMRECYFSSNWQIATTLRASRSTEKVVESAPAAPTQLRSSSTLLLNTRVPTKQLIHCFSLSLIPSNILEETNIRFPTDLASRDLCNPRRILDPDSENLAVCTCFDGKNSKALSIKDDGPILRFERWYWRSSRSPGRYRKRKHQR